MWQSCSGQQQQHTFRWLIHFPSFYSHCPPPTASCIPPALEDRVWCASQITLKLQSCSTGPSASSSCTFIGQDFAGCARPALLPAYWYTFVWEEMTSQHQTRWKQMRTKHFRCVLTWLGRSSACIPKSPWSEKNNNQAIKQALEQHYEICLLDTKRRRETLHVQVELLFSSPTLWWVVSSCWQQEPKLQLEHICCFIQDPPSFVILIHIYVAWKKPYQGKLLFFWRVYY